MIQLDHGQARHFKYKGGATMAKTSYLKCRVTDDIKITFKEKAEKMGMSESEYLRYLIAREIQAAVGVQHGE